jgi:hypothetical protein
MFDLPAAGVLKEWSDLVLESHEAGKIYLKTAKDHFIAKGTPIAIDSAAAISRRRMTRAVLRRNVGGCPSGPTTARRRRNRLPELLEPPAAVTSRSVV